MYRNYWRYLLYSSSVLQLLCLCDIVGKLVVKMESFAPSAQNAHCAETWNCACTAALSVFTAKMLSISGNGDAPNWLSISKQCTGFLHGYRLICKITSRYMGYSHVAAFLLLDFLLPSVHFLVKLWWGNWKKSPAIFFLRPLFYCLFPLHYPIS